MAEYEQLNSIAVDWIRTLTSRRVVLACHGKRLLMSPKSAFGEMTTAERQTLKRLKPEIIALIASGALMTPGSAVPAVSAIPDGGSFVPGGGLSGVIKNPRLRPGRF